MPTYTNIYQETRGGRTASSKRLKKNWRSIKKKIIEEEKQRFKKDLADKVFTQMKTRHFIEKRTDNGKDLPELEKSTLEWRAVNNFPGTTKLKNSGNLKRNFKRDSISTINNRIEARNNTINSRGQQYAYYLNKKDKRTGKRWVNLDIPDTYLPGGVLRKKLLDEFKIRIQKRFTLELYKKR